MSFPPDGVPLITFQMNRHYQYQSGGLFETREVRQTTYSNCKVQRATVKPEMRGDLGALLFRYEPLFNPDFTKFRKVDGCYMSKYPYSDSVIAVADSEMKEELCRKHKLVHCKTGLEYFDLQDKDLTSIKHSRWFAEMVCALRKKYPDLPAKKYQTLTVTSVVHVREDDVVFGYPIEKVIILPDGVTHLYLGPDDNYMHKSGESAHYDMSRDPIYWCDHTLNQPNRSPPLPSMTYHILDERGRPQRAYREPTPYVPTKLYQHEFRTEPSGCVLS